MKNVKTLFSILS